MLSGGPGSDFVNGGEGDDDLRGEAGADRLEGGAGDDQLAGGEGDDSLEGWNGNDVLAGGADRDSADYSGARNGVVVDLSITAAQPTLGAGTDTVDSVEDLIGSHRGDMLSGNSVPNHISSGAGDDEIYVRGGGDDEVICGAGTADLADTDPTDTRAADCELFVAPDTTIVAGPQGLTNDSTPSFEFASDKPQVTFECRLDEGARIYVPGRLYDAAAATRRTPCADSRRDRH